MVAAMPLIRPFQKWRKRRGAIGLDSDLEYHLPSDATTWLTCVEDAEHTTRS